MTRARDLADLLTGGQTITTADNTAQITLTSTDTDSGHGPRLNMERNPSEAGADGDNLGQIFIQGYNDAGTPELIDYFQLFTEIADASDGTEDARQIHYVMTGGSQRSRIEHNATETVINEDSVDVDFRVEGDTSNKLLFVDAGNERVEIHSASPELHLVDTTNNTDAIIRSNNNGDIVLEADENAERDSTIIRFDVDGSEKMRLDSSGNLLVGGTETNPQNQSSGSGSALRADGRGFFRATSATVVGANLQGNDGQVVRISKDGSELGGMYAFSSEIALVSGNTGLYFDDANNKIFPINGSGSVRDNITELGASNARIKNVYVKGTVFAEAFTGESDTDTAIQMTGSNVIKFFTNSSEKMRLDQDGKLLLGTTSTIAGAHISHLYDSVNGSGITLKSTDSSGNTHNQVIFDRNGSTVGTISTTASNTAYGTSSDRRLKSNIEDAESASDKIDAMQVRQFDWNVDGSHQDYGLIAQELEPIAPLAVTGDADSDEMMGVDYSKLVPMLIKEIQELRSRVATLEAS